ncbi:MULTISPECIES: hypothetical protein [Actinoalloteichus]|uniref:Uncharacterized protein n=1 Tax=Actinoalloteichus fjordicus TaxID=1612552 RepID=A0AAC9LA20_9PSEU|nr:MULTISPECIES: hypothetical protein [Actinoalloteichus]APU13963.1 hypothetical protein UA74_09500 [Actinoalloteichus fjordicus]APU19909.1 hypothetical protein UA75_09470 [Actinoalloteichus sp. GBA129-24]
MLAVIGPAPVLSGRVFKDLVSRGGLDEDFGRDVEQARELLVEQEPPWHDD